MESQYYFPTIDEFFCGFECEIKGKNESNWSKLVLGKDAIWHLFTNLEYLEQATEQIRVKHLDRQDIEECGWERDSTSSDWSAFNLKSEAKYNHCLTIDVGSKKEIGKNIVIFNNEGTIFKGAIRNKSELKKLMQMLNIKQ